MVVLDGSMDLMDDWVDWMDSELIRGVCDGFLFGFYLMDGIQFVMARYFVAMIDLI